MRKIKVVVLLVQQLQHGFTKNAKVSPNLTVAHIASGLGMNRFNLYASTSPMQKSGKHPFWTTLATVALLMP